MAKIQELKFTDKGYEKIVNYLNGKCFGTHQAGGYIHYFLKEEGYVIIDHAESELVSANLPKDMTKSLEAMTE